MHLSWRSTGVHPFTRLGWPWPPAEMRPVKQAAPPPAGQKTKVSRRMSIGADLWEDMTIRCKYVSTFEATEVLLTWA